MFFRICNIILSPNEPKNNNLIYLISQKDLQSAFSSLEGQTLSVWVYAGLTAEPAGEQRHNVHGRALVTGTSRQGAVQC